MGKGGEDRRKRRDNRSEPADTKANEPDPHSALTTNAGAEMVQVVERGSFALAMCMCGWSGPGRRARKRARSDAAEHLAQAHPGGRARQQLRP